ncbi:hypothetical protein GS610_06630 [Ruegeria sp. HKCCD6228]|uniref:hypothetical protein n=1 Tax=unclassified Ruegeria TaxID=2625375 RepID=UPI001487ACE4|nr:MULTISPECIES: hypothetical protein [unclassified Ruegeria]NOD96882.1 hypothetical protein [Ruegeria sp. HKCCD6228]
MKKHLCYLGGFSLLCTEAIAQEQPIIRALDPGTFVTDQFPQTHIQPTASELLGLAQTGGFGVSTEDTGLALRNLTGNELSQLVRTPGASQASNQIDFYISTTNFKRATSLELHSRHRLQEQMNG